jgi:hypothetical protein
VEACPRQLLALNALLNTFADFTGLRVNYQKSNIYSLNTDNDKMEILANTYESQIGSYLFTYLGLSLGPNKPNLDDMLPLV